MTTQVITNKQPRRLVTYADMPQKVRADFDYIDTEDHHSCRFVNYKNWWYDVGDMMRAPGSYWDVAHGESYFSGVLFKLLDDNYVIAGSYYEVTPKMVFVAAGKRVVA